jgi:hypothetical protein
MKKFTDITKKHNSIEFINKSKTKNLSNDINDLDKQISDQVNSTKLDGEWEIISIIDVSKETPKNEAIVINADIGGKEIKRGDILYITAFINKKGNTYQQGQMGVIKVRVIDIYNTILVLNNLK